MKRAEAIVRKGERRRGFVPHWLRLMAEVDVDFLEVYERIYELTAVRQGALPAKFREMIVCAAVAIGGYQAGLQEHVRRALRLGATKEELTEVFQSAYFHTGALTLVHRHDRAHRRAEGAGVATPASRRQRKRVRGSARPRT